MQQDETSVAKFESYLKDSGLDMTLSNNNPLVKKYLTAEFARQLFGESQYYRILLKDDTMLEAVSK
jgi:carboxyl-terminal processing protease